MEFESQAGACREPSASGVHLGFMGNGQDYHIRKWLPAIARQGVRVTLITFHPPDEALEGVEVCLLKPPFSGAADRASWIDFWGSTRPLRRLLRTRRVDVLMASYATNYGWMGARTGFRPLIVQTWTFDVSVFPFQGWKQVLLRPVVQYVLRRADVVTTDGEALAAFVRAHYPLPEDRVVSTRWGISLADYRPPPDLRAAMRAQWKIPPGAPVVVSARGVQAWYRPTCVLPALRRLLDAHPDVHVLVLTLAHPRPRDVQGYLDALDAHPRARVFDRFLTKEEMRAVWAVSDVLVSVPDRDGVSEGILEGMYAGVLPVVSDIPSNRSFLNERRAFFVSVAEAEDLVRTLLHVLGGLEAYQAERVAANRAWVERHASVESTARQVADLVCSLAGPA